MKKTLLLVAVAVVAIMMSACGGSNTDLSASKAKKICEKEIKRLHKDVISVTINTGYFECKEELDRKLYSAIAKCGYMTYSCKEVVNIERMRKYREVKHDGYWGSYTTREPYYVDEPVTHYFIDVQLTDKGKKLLYEEQEAELSDDDRELRKDFKPNYERYPEHEFLPYLGDNTEVEEGVEPVDNEDMDYAETASEYDEDATEYEIEKNKEHKEMVTLKGGELKVYKVRNIVRNDNVASGEAILEITNSTIFGRLGIDAYDGKRIMVPAEFKYYMDKGWVIVDLD